MSVRDYPDGINRGEKSHSERAVLIQGDGIPDHIKTEQAH